MDQDRRIEDLHEQASAAYLKGEFTSAMRDWRELLALDGEDERALEGVRLCELLVQETDQSSVFGTPAAVETSPAGAGARMEAATPAVGTGAGTPPPVAAQPVPEPVSEADPLAVLDVLLADADAPAAPAAPASFESEAIAAGFDLSDLDGLDDCLTLSAAEPAAPMGETVDLPAAGTSDTLELSDLPPIEADPRVVGAPETNDPGSGPADAEMSEAAAAELRARIDDLLLEATRSYETGDLEAALGVLARVFILEEEHPMATSLQAQIEKELEGDEAPADGSGTAGTTETAGPNGAYSSELPPGFDTASLADETPEAGESLSFETDLLEGAEQAAKSADPEPADLFDLDAVGAMSPAEGDPQRAPETSDPGSVSDQLFDPEAMPDPAATSDEELLDKFDLGEAEGVATNDPMTPPAGDVEASPEGNPDCEHDDPVSRELVGDSLEGGGAASPVSPKAPGIKARLAGLSSMDNRTKGIVAGVAVLVLALGGWFGWQLLGDDGANAALDEQVRSAKAIPKHTRTKSGTNDGEPGAKTADVAALSAPSRAEEIARTQTSADAAFKARDWPSAIMAYNRLLELDSTDEQAKEGFKQASEAYRAQNEYEDKLIGAIAMFDRGDYRAALKIFYRLPGAADDPRFDRYKAHGWHNLGVAALQVNDCAEAQSHFTEVEMLAPSDPDLPRMIELARRCRQARRDPSYRAAVDALPFRAVDE